MRRIFTLLSFLLLPLLGMSQLRVVEGSFKEIPGFVDMSEKTDDNNKPFAVVIIKTLNINEQERAKLRFSSDAMSYVEVEYRVGEVWLYVSYYASFLKIKHPDLSSAPDFYLPFDMQPRHGYELVLEKYNVAPAPDTQTINYLIVRCDQPDASICIDGSFVGMKEGSKALGVGEKHSWQIDCGLYHSESGEVTITEGEPVTVERKLRPAYGFLKVTSSPENGATVFIDNKMVGTTPYTSERLQSGSYNVRVMKEMFSLSEKSFLVKDNETTVANMVLNPNFATLSLNTDPASDIFIDGERVAKGQWNGRLSSGTHLVEARKPSHRNSSLKVNLSNGENKTLTIPNPEPIYSMLDINSQPMGAKILIDGEDFGTTPRVIKNILVGEHTLSLVKQGCAKLEKTFTLKEKEMLSLNEKLESGKIITVTTDKEGDEIYVDGTFAGHSPLDVSMGYGRHTVKAIRNGKSVEKSFDVSENGGESSLLLKFSRNQTITVNGVSFEMVYVEGGSFDMGSDADSYEKPVHSVTLSDYYIGRCEVTQELWEAVMGSNPSYFKGAQNPVECVSWNDCQEFVSRLSSLTGRTFRLPTEAEWEYAARGGKKSSHYKYSGSDNIDDVAWYDDNSGDKTRPVGTKSPNELGIYDMSGNVYEWCSDWYGSYSAGAQTNPQGPSSGSCRVLRGGPWDGYAGICRVLSRYADFPSYSYSSRGLRLVLVPNEVTSIPQQQEQYSPQQEYGGGFSNQTITVKGVSFEMVYVEGGSFDMGATSEQGSDAWDNEKPVHSVTLSGYYIGRCEVTQELWEAVMGSNPSNFRGAQNPVESVSWNDCQNFIKKLNSLTGMTFRLPTEAEWEYAARGGNKSSHYKYSGSGNIGDVAWYGGNSGGKTHAVGTKSPNELGIYDMSGNVWEWCSDWYGSYRSGARTNPQGPSSGSLRVLRGGSWYHNARYCRVSNRLDYFPDDSRYFIGLRLVLVP